LRRAGERTAASHEKNLLDKVNDLLYDNYRCEGSRLLERPADPYNASGLRVSLDA
jgi:hypothetical protein